MCEALVPHTFLLPEPWKPARSTAKRVCSNSSRNPRPIYLTILSVSFRNLQAYSVGSTTKTSVTDTNLKYCGKIGRKTEAGSSAFHQIAEAIQAKYLTFITEAAVTVV